MPLWSCAYGSENCREEWSNSWQQRQLQRSAMIATQADVRNRFCCPQGGGEFVASRRQWLECYDCHATWCEEPATKRFCCPKDNLDTGQLIKPHLQCASFLLPRKNLHGEGYWSVARKNICRVKPRIPGNASLTNKTVVSPTYQSRLLP